MPRIEAYAEYKLSGVKYQLGVPIFSARAARKNESPVGIAQHQLKHAPRHVFHLQIVHELEEVELSLGVGRASCLVNIN